MKGKEEIRNEIRYLKRNLTAKQIKEQSACIANNLCNTKEYQSAQVVYIYFSYNQEVITKNIIVHALAHGKKVAIPKVEKGKIVFYYMNGLEDVKVGYQGIYEPLQKQQANETEILMIMPGLAFDRKGNRMGYGGGFYDNYLLDNVSKIRVKIALAYDFQVIDQLNVEQHDQKVDIIITQSNIICCRDT